MVIVTMIFAAWAAVASTAALLLIAGGRTQNAPEPAERPEADPAKVMREWFYGGES